MRLNNSIDSAKRRLHQRSHHYSLRHILISAAIFCAGFWGQNLPTLASPKFIAQTPSPTDTPTDTPTNSNSKDIDISPEILNSSPVLRKWMNGIPDVMSEIQTDPSFRTRIKFGYAQYPSTAQSGGFYGAVDDLFVGKSGLSVSANYDASSTGNRRTYGADAQYFLLPLGGYFNVTPLVGFRHLETDKYSRDGLNLGVKLILVPSRGGGGDISLSQSFVGLGGANETGLTTLSVGYAFTNNLRISTDIQLQNAKENYDSRVGVGIEWMP
jgi:hypothetical protein